MEAKVYNTKGTASGNITLPEALFGVAWNADLVHDVVTSMRGNARANTAHTKGRGEVRGGGRKPWRQKGTGRARHGSRRSPIWRGGGITFGPRTERDYSRKINRKMRAKALAVTLSKKFADGEVGFVDAFAFAAPKAKEAQTMLGALGVAFNGASIVTKRKNAALIVLASRDQNTEKSFQNFGNVHVTQAKDLNPVELVTYKYVLIAQPAESVAALAARLSGAKAETSVSAAEEQPKAAKKAVKKTAAKKPGKATTAKKTARKATK